MRMFSAARIAWSVQRLATSGRSGDRIPAGARFSIPLQTGPGTHPVSCTMSAVSLPGLKWPGRGVNHPPLSSAEVEEIVELHFYSHPAPSWPILG